MTKQTRILSQNKGKNATWITTEDTKHIGYIAGTLNTWAALKATEDIYYYPVQVIVFQYEVDNKDSAKELIKAITKTYVEKLVKVDNLQRGDYHYEVWQHPNPYWNSDAIRTLKSNLKFLGFSFDKIANTWDKQ